MSVQTKPEAPPQRSFGRLDFWWFPKVGPALALSYCAALVFHVPGWTTLRSAAVVAFVGLCAGSYGYLLNDVCDLEVDRRAGKSNRMAAFSPFQRALFCAIALGLGFAPSLVLPTSRTTLLLLGLEYLILTVYSVPPLRLKARGFLGLLCDASGAHVGASLYVLSVLYDGRTTTSSSSPDPLIFIGLVLLWQLCLGLIGILVHQVEDRRNDIRSGIRTFATERSFGAIRLPMSCVYGVELLAFAALCMLLRRVAPLVLVAALLYAAILALKLWTQWRHYRNVTDERIVLQWWQLSHPCYEAYLPLAAALQCTLLHPQLFLFALFHGTVFFVTIRRQMYDLRGAWDRLLTGGRLDVADTAMARLRPLFLPRPAGRVEIGIGGAKPWEVRLMRRDVVMRSGQDYAISLKLRADTPRDITFGVWQDHSPWRDLGCCEQLSLSANWQTISRQFTAVDDDRRSYLGLWLGGSSAAVEIRRWSIRPIRTAKARTEVVRHG